MPKNLTTTTSLVIVESPAKCKKIEEYLGPGYKCMASYGHIRELPSIKNIDIENNFNPTYTVIDNAIKKKNIENLRKEIKLSREVILATDDDREGESIAWHLCEVFKLNINKTKRIVFNEITESALLKALENYRTVNLDLINAQKTRQILDVLVGFKISPILWKLVSQPKGKDNALSAGRCQIPALRLVYENQKEIEESIEKKNYSVTGYFTNLNLPYELNCQDKFDDEDKVIDFLDKSINFSHIYTFSQPVKIFKHPPEPFTTSRLQQVASNELHYSPKETMRLCQILYEAGYITYMRTDSKVYCEPFVDLVFEYITKNYDTQYFNQKLKLNNNETNKELEKYKKKKRDFTQEAHEAIRPTDISLKELPERIDSKEKRMYKLIWKNTLESCMVDASFYSITSTISAPHKTKYSHISELIDFPGWKIVENKFSRDNHTYQYLQTIKQNVTIEYKKICSNVVVKGLKMHYTEAKLVQLLEEYGIGRPSTFSYLVDKIQERGYVKKEDINGKEIVCKDFELEDGEICEIENKRVFGNEKGKLIIQPLGKIVIEFLIKNFSSLFDYKYTSSMEESLDKIAKGQMVWYEICSDCNKEIDTSIESVKNDTKFEFQIDENNTYIIGKYGPVIKCIEEKDGKEEITFKSVKKDIDLNKLENGECELNDIVDTGKKQNTQYILGQYQGNDVILKKGKFGLYISWGENSKTLKNLGNRPIENITFNEIKPYLEEGSTFIREINSSLSIRKGPKGDYLFFKNSKMKKPIFHDIKCFVNETNENYKICDITILKSWINQKYNIF